MLVGYVSNERYVAVPNVLFEFRGTAGVTTATSTVSGAVYAEIEPGEYQVVLGREGYGSKLLTMTASDDSPYNFRVLSDSLLGYMWPKCVQSGQRSEFRVHAVEEYELELWRYGADKEFIRRIGTFDEHGPRATMQITPDGDYTQTGIEWNKQGYNSPAHHQYIEAPERCGLYYFHARSKSGDFFTFPWVVGPKQPQSKIAVLASDITWNAYNSYGGRSNYIHPDKFPPTPTVNSRLELERYTDPDHISYKSIEYAPLSLDRPEPFNHIAEDEQITGPIGGRQGCHLAPAEWRLFGWMERDGFDYDLYGETQFHFDTFRLDDYRLLIISTHPEYWSKHMYDTLKSWVFERGGRLMYLGGNGFYWRIAYHDALPGVLELRRAEGGMRYQTTEPGEYHQSFNGELGGLWRRLGAPPNTLVGAGTVGTGFDSASYYRRTENSHDPRATFIFEGVGDDELIGDFGSLLGGAAGVELDGANRKLGTPPHALVVARSEGIHS